MFKYAGIADLPAEKVIVVTQEYESNLPALSLLAYGSMHHWEVLLWANGLLDPLTIPVGTVLKVPDLSKVKDLQRVGGKFNGMS